MMKSLLSICLICHASLRGCDLALKAALMHTSKLTRRPNCSVSFPAVKKQYTMKTLYDGRCLIAVRDTALQHPPQARDICTHGIIF